MNHVVLAGALRTPLGDFGGTLKGVSAAEMAQLVMERVCATTDQVTAVGKVIFGNCFAPLDQNVARVAAYRAGIPDSVP
ncbi:MAG: acetyl-CoA C-acetyltransferase, partial [Thermodesulfobacteriota bacterium]|nr:acetyl-CoA C-acetyltransferase [Thermodesulfobacteriota bacterium]